MVAVTVEEHLGTAGDRPGQPDGPPVGVRGGQREAPPARPEPAGELCDVIRRGPCSGAADWKLKASPENGRIEVEGEVDSNVNGQTWRWRILHNGASSARGTATTTAPSGSFEVRRLVVNAAGTDPIGWRARHVASGQTCRGHLQF